MRNSLLSLSAVLLLTVLLAPRIGAQQAPMAEERLWGSAVRAWIDRGEYSQARLWLEEHMEQTTDPDFAYAYLYCLYEEGAYGRLLRLVGKKQFVSAASQPRTRLLVGLTNWQRGETMAAAQDWLVLLTQDPRNDRVWECIRVGFLSADRRVRRDLLVQIERATRGTPFAQAFLMGLMKSLRGPVKEAEGHLLEARSLFPESLAAARALRHLYRHTGNMEGARSLTAWLEKQEAETGTESGGGLDVNSNKSSDLWPNAIPTGPVGAPCRLPWPAGQAVFCGSHEGRHQTPHRDRGQYALDFLLPIATPVLAARGGVVSRLKTEHKTFGGNEFETYVLIDHGDGTFGRYYHLRGGTIRVRKGQLVRQGQILASSGRTGCCQSRHLHFEVVRKADRQIKEPSIYRQWSTIPVQFEEAGSLRPEQMPGRWYVSGNKIAP